MKTLRLGLIGLGNMGQAHARSVLSGQVRRVRLTAVADTDPARLAVFSGLPGFPDASSLIRSGLVDAVLIATPHYHHTAAGIEVLRAGLHLLIETPISVHKADCQKLLAAHRATGQVFAAMFHQRTSPLYRKLRRLLQNGQVGEIRRINWIATDWFRSQAYYASSAWRATWDGEGGGVLLNQCPHHLDLFQWLFGMPTRVRGFCSFGRYHAIEVEDDVTAYFELPGGAHATFIASTGEAPGTNRLEVTAERGKIVIDGGRLTFTRNAIAMSAFSATTKTSFAIPANREIAFPVESGGARHTAIIRNFAAAILDGAPLLAPAAEGARSVELANAILLSAWTAEPIALPMSGQHYARCLQRKIDQAKLIRAISA